MSVETYRVYLRSRPGFYEQYDGHVDVSRSDDDETNLFMLAVRKLRRTSFPDRGPECWKFEKVERLS